MNSSYSTELDGRIIVFKVSGKFGEEEQHRKWLVEDALLFHDHGAREAIVYGGQERISQELIDAGIESEFDGDGIRIIRTRKGAEADRIATAPWLKMWTTIFCQKFHLSTPRLKDQSDYLASSGEPRYQAGSYRKPPIYRLFR